MENTFIFVDDEWGYFIVKWAIEEFEEVYCRLQNYYSDNQLDYSDFYDQLVTILKVFWIEIRFCSILLYNDLNFNKYRNGKQD